MAIMTAEVKTKIESLFTRGVAELIDPEGKFQAKVVEKAAGRYPKDIIIKFGVDPTRPDIHLGHAVVFRKLREFQDLGCKVVFLIGDFTAQIGDPTGKSKVRPELEQKEVEANMKTFIDQVSRILLTEPHNFSWIRNSDWYTAVTDLVLPPGAKVKSELLGEVEANTMVGKALVYENTRMQKTYLKKVEITAITLRSLVWTLRHITHGRLIQRDFFQERLRAGEELYLHELLYPVLQGIDSNVLARIYDTCDLEIGGTDQTFNMLVGRDVMRINHQEPQAVLALRLLTGLDGHEKMSKSSDNYIAITDAPELMYGKVMSLPDKSLQEYFELCTYASLNELAEIKERLADSQINPRDLKMRLAHEIVAIYHGERSAVGAEESFVNTFSKKIIPEDLPTVEAKRGEKLADVLLRGKIIKSKSDFRRLLDEGAIHDLETGQSVSDPEVLVKNNWKLKIGKKRFVKIIVK